MAKYKGSIELISGIVQKNGGTFPLIDASAVQVDDNDTRLSKVLEDLKNGTAINSVDYANVLNKPQLEGIELTGNKTIVELGILDSTLSVTNKAADSKAVGDKIAPLETKAHTHDNKTELDLVVTGKVAEWDSKETPEQAQAKATKALEDAKAYSDNAIKTLVGAAPSTLDTIYEIAAELQKNNGAVETITSQLAGKAEKVHEHKIADITDFKVVNDLLSTSTTDALSAAQGKELKALIDGIHNHENKAELDLITVGKVAAWDAKADGKHDHTLAEITDMFTVENILTSVSETNALSAAQGKALNDRLALVETDKHTHANKGELDKITDGKVAIWDNKAESNHQHGIADLTDMFKVIDASNNASTTDALSANQGKILNEKITAVEASLDSVHTHANKDELDKIVAGKVTEWDAKETTTGSQAKADASLNASKAYTNERVDSIIVNPSKKMTVNNFSEDLAIGLFKATVKHNLNTEHILVDAYNTTTKENELVSYKIIDANTIEVFAEDGESIEILVIGEGVKIATLQQGSINDGVEAAESTWSSQKIAAEINAIKAHLKLA